VVVGVSLRAEKVSEHTAQIGNVWLGFELQAAAVRKVLGKLAGAALAESGDRDGLFLFHDKLVLFGGGFGLEALPGQSTLEEIDQNVSNGFQVISARLFHAQVIVDGGVTRRTRQRASFSLRNVLQGTRVAITLRQSKVDTVDEISVSASRIRNKIGGLDVSVNQMARMHELHTFEHLIRHHEHRLKGESTTALIKLILERRSKEIHNHKIVGILCTKVMNFGKAGGILQFTVNLILVTKLRASCAVLFKFYSDL